MSQESTTDTALAEAPVDIVLPPTQDELPCDDGEPMETARHRMQMELLINSLNSWLSQREDGFAGGNMFLYFSMEQVRGKHFQGPDVFVVLDVPKGERKSWVVWEEGKGPDVIVELLSSSTAAHDKSGKKSIYQNQLRVPEYFWFDPFNADDWAGFRLQGGEYEPIVPDEKNRLVSLGLGLALRRWHGVFNDVETTWLRWESLAGDLLLTGQELAERQAELAQQQAELAQQQAELAQQQAAKAALAAEQAEQKAEKLAAGLRALGVDPDRL